MNREWKVNKVKKEMKINPKINIIKIKMRKTRRTTIIWKTGNKLVMIIKLTQNLVLNKARMKKYQNITSTE